MAHSKKNPEFLHQNKFTPKLEQVKSNQYKIIKLSFKQEAC